jgi:hypothetical protein
METEQTTSQINRKISELISDLDEEVIGTVFVPKEQVKAIMRRKMVLLTEFLNKQNDNTKPKG